MLPVSRILICLLLAAGVAAVIVSVAEGVEEKDALVARDAKRDAAVGTRGTGGAGGGSGVQSRHNIFQESPSQWFKERRADDPYGDGDSWIAFYWPLILTCVLVSVLASLCCCCLCNR